MKGRMDWLPVVLIFIFTIMFSPSLSQILLQASNITSSQSAAPAAAADCSSYQDQIDKLNTDFASYKINVDGNAGFPWGWFLGGIAVSSLFWLFLFWRQEQRQMSIAVCRLAEHLQKNQKKKAQLTFWRGLLVIWIIFIILALIEKSRIEAVLVALVGILLLFLNIYETYSDKKKEGKNARSD